MKDLTGERAPDTTPLPVAERTDEDRAALLSASLPLLVGFAVILAMICFAFALSC